MPSTFREPWPRVLVESQVNMRSPTSREHSKTGRGVIRPVFPRGVWTHFAETEPLSDSHRPDTHEQKRAGFNFFRGQDWFK